MHCIDLTDFIDQDCDDFNLIISYKLSNQRGGGKQIVDNFCHVFA